MEIEKGQIKKIEKHNGFCRIEIKKGEIRKKK